MDRLYAPWRSGYAADADVGKQDHATAQQCVFCNHLADNTDEKHFIFRRFKYNFIMLNLFPYNAGHLMVLPLEHKATLDDIHPQARTELMELTTSSVRIVSQVLKAQGVNIGMNLGKAAGAGIPSHAHMHILPRWVGDTNFLPTIGHTKQISFDLVEIYTQLKPAFDEL